MSIVLVSGGLDSATALAWALRNTKGPLHALSFQYGQRHNDMETRAAAQLCELYRVPLRTVNLVQAFAVIGGSSLTSGMATGNPSKEEGTFERTPSDLPPTFVPGRNLIFLGIAASVGYVMRDYELVGGWNAVDYSGYPDCRERFFEQLEAAADEAFGFDSADEHGIEVHAPLVNMSKADIIRLGLELNVPYSVTWSCYAGGLTPCGECDSCKIRAEGFAAVGVEDPALNQRR